MYVTEKITVEKHLCDMCLKENKDNEFVEFKSFSFAYYDLDPVESGWNYKSVDLCGDCQEKLYEIIQKERIKRGK